MGRYAEWAPTRREFVLHRVRVALRRLLRPYRWARARVERLPVMVRRWERHAGPDYTGWQVRALTAVPRLGSGGDLVSPGEVGTVQRWERWVRRRSYTVVFDRAILITKLPDPERVELLGPPQQR